MTLTHPGVLVGKLVTLEPLTQDHCAGLAEASQDGDLSQIWYSVVASPENMAEDIDKRILGEREGCMYQYAVRHNGSGKILGMSGYLSLDHDVPRVEVGFTWFGNSAQGTGANPESKLLLMQHAFEVWQCAAVEFSTDWHNTQSRAAIAKLGAKEDGVIRSYRRQTGGYLRDLVMFSILASEWPGVKLGLEARVRRHLDAALVSDD